MRAGVRVGVDVGTVRVGVALSDPEGRLAFPHSTLRRDVAGHDQQVLAGLVRERAAVEVLVGFPRTLAGREGAAAAAARAYADRLAVLVAPVRVRLVDERLTTVSADRALRAARPQARVPARRKVVDQMAAALILQAALDAERSQRTAPGTEPQ